MNKLNQEKILKAFIKEAEKLDRSKAYKAEIVGLLGDVINRQREFDLKVSGKIVPEIENEIDAFAQGFDNKDEI